MTPRPVSIGTALAFFEEHWSPRIWSPRSVTRVTDWNIRLAKVEGSYLWRIHVTVQVGAGIQHARLGRRAG